MHLRPGIRGCLFPPRTPRYPEELGTGRGIDEDAFPLLRPAARSVMHQDLQLLRPAPTPPRPAGPARRAELVRLRLQCYTHRMRAPRRVTSTVPSPPSAHLFRSSRPPRPGHHPARVSGRSWDLFFLDPGNSGVPASESLREEIALARPLRRTGLPDRIRQRRERLDLPGGGQSMRHRRRRIPTGPACRG